MPYGSNRQEGNRPLRRRANLTDKPVGEDSRERNLSRESFMTKKKENPLSPGRKPIPEKEKLIPLNLQVKPKTRARFVKRALELGLSQPKTLEHLLNHEKP